MSFLKTITNFFTGKKKTIPEVVEEKKDYKENFGMLIPECQPEKKITGSSGYGDGGANTGSSGSAGHEPPVKVKQPAPTQRKSFSQQFASGVPTRPTSFFNPPPRSNATKEFVSTESDVTPNPLKYWRKFRRGNKVYRKKFYHERQKSKAINGRSPSCGNGWQSC